MHQMRVCICMYVCFLEGEDAHTVGQLYVLCTRKGMSPKMVLPPVYYGI